jgi:hypothetical protein
MDAGMSKVGLLAGLVFAGVGRAANATLITSASLFSPQPPAQPLSTAIDLAGVVAPSQATISNANYAINFNTTAEQGLVQGALAGRHAIPVAGQSGGQSSFLTGGFGSAQTTSAAGAGSYLSTGGPGSSIVVTFATPQSSLALLWGSIDAGNRIAFDNVSRDVLTGAAVQGMANGFVSNGFQGAGGSAYVSITSDTPFTTVTLSSDVISFEATALIASRAPVSVPEPLGLVLLGAGIAGIGVLRRLTT